MSQTSAETTNATVSTRSNRSRRFLRWSGAAIAVAGSVVALLPASAQAYEPRGTQGTTLPVYTSGASITCSPNTITINPGTIWAQGSGTSDYTLVLFREMLSVWNGSYWAQYATRDDWELANVGNRTMTFAGLPKNGSYTLTLFVWFFPVPSGPPSGLSIWKSTPFDYKYATKNYNGITYCNGV